MALLDYNTNYIISLQDPGYQEMYDALMVLNPGLTAKEANEDGIIDYVEITNIVDRAGNRNGVLTGDDFTAILFDANRFSGNAIQAVETIRNQIKLKPADKSEIDGF